MQVKYALLTIGYWGSALFSQAASEQVTPKEVIPAAFQSTTYAIIKDPVVDLFLALPIQEKPSLYSKGTRRAHQGLFNERVRCLEQNGTCVKIVYTNLMYGTHEDGTPRNTFWIDKKHLLFPTDFSKFPDPSYAHKPTVVLIFPWKHFSVGTRFIHVPECDTQHHYAAQYYKSEHDPEHIQLIPKNRCFIEREESAQQKRQKFVRLAQQLIHRAGTRDQHSVIPYVWGGSSYVWPYKDHFTYSQKTGWQRSGKNNPYTGFDCSELVWRLAQICNIKYPFKTSKIAADTLHALTSEETLEEGDLLWIPGHIMIISDIAKHELIEARGYDHGYGKAQIIKLEQVFKGMDSYQKLINAYLDHLPLERLNNKGHIVEAIKEFKILKLCSA